MEKAIIVRGDPKHIAWRKKKNDSRVHEKPTDDDIIALDTQHKYFSLLFHGLTICAML